MDQELITKLRTAQERYGDDFEIKEKIKIVENPEAGDHFEPVMVYAESFNKDVPQKIDKPFIRKIVNMMDQWSKPNSQDLFNTILVVKGGATSIAKKVSKPDC